MKYSLLLLLLVTALSVGCASTRRGCNSCGQAGGCDAGCNGGRAGDGGGCANGQCGIGAARGRIGAARGGLRAQALAQRADQRGPATMQGPATPAVAYPYYTTRAPRDFFLDNPPSIGR